MKLFVLLAAAIFSTEAVNLEQRCNVTDRALAMTTDEALEGEVVMQAVQSNDDTVSTVAAGFPVTWSSAWDGEHANPQFSSINLRRGW